MRSTWKAIVVAAIASLALAAPAAAKTYEVTKRGDPTPNACKKKDCSLREAVIAANAHPGADKLVLPKKKTYNLSIANSIPPGEDEAAEGDLDITDDLDLVHPGKGKAKVDAHGIDRVLDVFGGATTTLNRIVTRGGAAPEGSGGGGIRSEGDLTLKRSGVVGNSAPSIAAGGGGILLVSSADLVVARSTVRANETGGDGGGIDGNDGVIQVRRSKIIDNASELGAGGIHFFSEASEPSQLVKSTISRNRAQGQGGGILVSAMTVSISGSTIAGNSVGGVNGQGGGIGVDGPGSLLVITNSTVTENDATGPGGGVFSGNGDGVRANAITAARNSANFGGGLYSGSGAPFEIQNSLVAFNTAPDGPECSDDGPADPFAIDSLGHNLLSDDTDCDGFDANGDFVNPNPKLGQLKSNGGPTQTVALKKGSPAINRANKASAPKKDQRGVKRGKKPDAGAYERVKKKHHHRR